MMIPDHFCNVPTIHHAFKIQLLLDKVAARLSQGGNSFKSKVVTRLWTGSSNLVTRSPYPCQKLEISVWARNFVAS